MKEFSSIISVYPINELESDPNPWLSDQDGTHSFMADNFNFSPIGSEEEAGTIYNCSNAFNITTPSDAELKTFSHPVKSILVVKDTTGAKYPIGTLTIPGTVIIQRGIQNSRLIFNCKSLINPL